MEEEIRSFTKVWTIAMASGCYCYTLSKATQKGIQRLFPVIPIIAVFTTVPFSLSTVHLGGPTAFYLLWLANFKLPSLPSVWARSLLLTTYPSPISSSPSSSPNEDKQPPQNAHFVGVQFYLPSNSFIIPIKSVF
ncbi:hypothetical protein V2J09_004092 [Rumex salicifolius]